MDDSKRSGCRVKLVEIHVANKEDTMEKKGAQKRNFSLSCITYTSLSFAFSYLNGFYPVLLKFDLKSNQISLSFRVVLPAEMRKNRSGAVLSLAR